MSERYVNVRRTVVAYFRVPADQTYYPDMSEQEINDFELDMSTADPELQEIFFDYVVDEKAEVWFDDLGPDGAK